ncbi:hypothetical protein GCM10022252_36630 [Streptosporangium oxazolinicum]|uniref:Uncharacterized protein n=1 Tax=Streptosporangium oxazolinicum TaxID=909287 RepID=A0ABP8AYB0_9ACTN
MSGLSSRPSRRQRIASVASCSMPECRVAEPMVGREGDGEPEVGVDGADRADGAFLDQLHPERVI